MAIIKKLFKALTPPLILSLIKKIYPKSSSPEYWYGDFSTWEHIKPECSGYDAHSILETCKNALLKVKNGEAVYERDSILFDTIQYSWGLLAGLQRAALENNGVLSVLDFGGSLGTSYFQNKTFLSSVKELKWCIIEQDHFVNCGKVYFEDDQLKFFHTIKDCLINNQPNVILLSSVLQYLENPWRLIDELIALNVPYIIFDRLALCDEDRDILTIQDVPAYFYKSRLGHWFFSKQKIVTRLSTDFSLVAEAPSFADEPYLLNGRINCHFDLLIFKKNEMLIM